MIKDQRYERDFQQLQEDLNKLIEWSDKWLLKFHPGKCHVMDVGNKQFNNKYEYELDGTKLAYVNEE